MDALFNAHEGKNGMSFNYYFERVCLFLYYQGTCTKNTNNEEYSHGILRLDESGEMREIRNCCKLKKIEIVHIYRRW